ncbi:MAG TPA: YCF48-related protein, partial [Cytophagaceae bacterium]
VNSRWDRCVLEWVADRTGDVEIDITIVGGTGTYRDIFIDDLSFTQDCNKNILPFPEYPDVLPSPCDEELHNVAMSNKAQRLKMLTPDPDAIRTSYIASCAKAKENLNYKYDNKEHHYTLYYYDQAGNLLKTVPPQGVNILDQVKDADKLARIVQDRLNRTYTLSAQPRHSMASTYKYNSLNQLVQQSVPDNDQVNLFETAPTSFNPAQTVTNIELGDNGEGFLIAKDGSGISHFYNTTNGGANWNETNGLGIENLNQIKFTSPTSNKAYAVGDKGTVLVTTDNGVNWTAEQIGSSGDLVDLHIYQEGNIAIFEKNGLIWTTSGSGYITYPGLRDILKGELQQVVFSGQNGYAVSKDANRGYIYKSGPQALTWEEITVSVTAPSKTTFLDNSNGLAYAGNGIFLNTKDGGLTWKIISSTLSFADAHDLIMTGVDQACIIGDNGQLHIASNGFGNWQAVSTNIVGDGKRKFSKSPDGALFVAGGLDKKVFRSIDGGKSWQLFSDLSTEYIGGDIVGLSSPKATEVYTSDMGGKVYQSFNNSTKTLIPTPSNVVNIHFERSNKGCAVVLIGNSALVHHLDVSNGIVDWTQSIVNNQALRVNDFKFFNPKEGYAHYTSGSQTSVYYTSDGGVTWAEKNSLPINAYVQDFYFLDKNKGYIKSVGQISYTFDGGANWITKTGLPATPNRLNAIANVSGTLIMGGDEGLILKSSTDGLSPVRSGTTASINTFGIVSGSQVVAATGGQMIGSVNTGESWSATTTFSSSINSIAFSTTMSGVAVGQGGIIMTTSDGGQNWLGLTPTTSQNFNAIATNGMNIMVGQGGAIYRGISSFAAAKGVDPMNIAGSTLVKGTSIGFAVGAKGTVAKTVDKGKSWKLVPFPSSKNLLGVHFKNAEVGVVVGEGGTIYKTENGGSSWTNASTTSSTLYSVALSGNNGYIAGDGVLLVSTNNGSSWTTKKTIVGTKAYSIIATDDKTAYAVGQAGAIYKTEDAGENWTLKQSVTPTASTNWTTKDLKSVYFTTYITGYAVGNEGTVLKTINEGASWKQVGETPFTGDFNDIAFSDANHAALGGANNIGGMASTLDDYTDELSSRFWYDELGRLIVSQNAKQFKTQDYSYTDYDVLGRIREVGQLHKEGNVLPVLNEVGQITLKAFTDWLNPSENPRTQVTRTYYDDDKQRFGNLAREHIVQENLRTRVSAILYQSTSNEDYDRVINTRYDHATYYSYDIHGNVKTLLQDNPSIGYSQESESQRFKKIDYKYDLISGNVNEVYYQPGQKDQYLHRYSYDADNRITSVETSIDNVNWTKDAKYFYYKHGPLKRVELGEYNVQGMDYVYTLQGWIKAVNSNNL